MWKDTACKSQRSERGELDELMFMTGREPEAIYKSDDWRNVVRAQVVQARICMRTEASDKDIRVILQLQFVTKVTTPSNVSGIPFHVSHKVKNTSWIPGLRKDGDL